MARKGRPPEGIDWKVIDLWEQGYDDVEIAERLGRAVCTIAHIRAQLGYKKEAPITADWLKNSGVGRRWDKTCERFRHDGTEA